MKHLIKINELIHIDTYNLDKLRDLVGKNYKYKKLLNIINERLDEDGVFFMDVNDFSKWYEEEIKEIYPDPPPLWGGLYTGIVLLATFPEFTDDAIIITRDSFVHNFSSEESFNRFKSFLEPIITHENIHKVQADKKDPKYIPHSNVNNFAEYVSHPDELMAWANTIAHEIIEMYPDEMPKNLMDVMQYTRSGRSVFSTFRDINDPIRKKFIKYVYQYLDKMYDDRNSKS
jgi:hypothetical protein